MFPTTCVTFSRTSLPPPTRKCVSSLFTAENVMPGFMLPAQRPLNLLCKRSNGGMRTHTHTRTHPSKTDGKQSSGGSRSCTLHLCLTPLTSITRSGHQGWAPSKHFTCRWVLAFKPQFPEGTSPPRDSLCGSGGKTLLLG